MAMQSSLFLSQRVWGDKALNLLTFLVEYVSMDCIAPILL